MRSANLFAAIAVSFVIISCQKDDMLELSPVSELQEEFNEGVASFEVLDSETLTSDEFAERLGVQAPLETKAMPALRYEISRISYTSTGADGKPITLSMKIALPKGLLTYHNPDHIILDNHFTIGSDAEAPFNKDPMALAKALENALVVCPDYEGYGVTKKNDHPYICHEINARQSVDAVLAALDYVDSKKGVSMAKNYWLDNYGYSQGGGIALAVHKFIETQLPAAKQKRLNLKQSFCGGGPYDPVATYRVYKEWEELANPLVAAMPLLGAKVAFPEVLGKYELSDFFQPEFYNSEVLARVKSKKYTTDELNEYIQGTLGITRCSQIFSDQLLDESTQMAQDVFACMERSNLTTGWLPKKKVFIYHSSDDNIVPMENSVIAYDRLKEGNVEQVWAPLDPTHQISGAFFYLKYMGILIVDGLLNSTVAGWLNSLI